MVNVDFILKQKHRSIVFDFEAEEDAEEEEEEEARSPADEAVEEEVGPSSLGEALPPLPPPPPPAEGEEEPDVLDWGREMPSCSAISTWSWW